MAHMQVLPSSRLGYKGKSLPVPGSSEPVCRDWVNYIKSSTYLSQLRTIIYLSINAMPALQTPASAPPGRSRLACDSRACTQINNNVHVKNQQNSRHGCSRPLVLRFHQMRRQQRRREHTTQRHPPRKIQDGVYVPVAVRSCRISIQMLRHKRTHDAE